MHMSAQHTGKGPQIGHGPRETDVQVVLCRKPFGRFAQTLCRLPDGFGQIGVGGFGGLCPVFDFFQHAESGLAPVHQFARHKVHRLNAVRAFIDRGDAHIAGILGRARFFDKAHAAVDLNAGAGDLAADVCAKSLADRCQERGAGLPSVLPVASAMSIATAFIKVIARAA